MKSTRSARAHAAASGSCAMPRSSRSFCSGVPTEIRRQLPSPGCERGSRTMRPTDVQPPAARDRHRCNRPAGSSHRSARRVGSAASVPVVRQDARARCRIDVDALLQILRGAAHSVNFSTASMVCVGRAYGVMTRASRPTISGWAMQRTAACAGQRIGLRQRPEHDQVRKAIERAASGSRVARTRHRPRRRR